MLSDPARTAPSAHTDATPNDRSAIYLVFDQGGSSSRALLFDHQGQVVLRAQQPVETHYPACGWVEQDPNQLLQSLQGCAEQLLQQLPVQQHSCIRSWGLACQRSNVLGWDRLSGEALTPVLSWQDLRTQLATENPNGWFNDGHTRFIRQRCGLYPSHHHGGPKLAWLLQQPVLQSAREAQRLWLTPLSSYLAAGLGGRLGSERVRVDSSCAQRTLLWNHRRRDWDPQLLALFNIPYQVLPPISPCCSDWGLLRSANSPHPIPGRCVGGDQGLAHLGQGKPDPQTLQINLGSGGFISLAVPEQAAAQSTANHALLISLAVDGTALQHTCSAPGDHWMVEGTINGAGSALRWLERQFPDQQAGFKQLRYSALDPNPGLFINAVSGLGSPYWRADLNSRLIDCHSLTQQYSAVIESMLFLIRVNLKQLQRAGFEPERIMLGGGLAQQVGLAQRLSDLCELPVLLNPEVEATARGLGWMLAGQPESWGAVDTIQYRPQPAKASGLKRRYQRWSEQLKAEGITPA